MDSVLAVKIISACLYPLGLFFAFYLFSWVCKRRGAWRKFWRLSAWTLLILASNPQVSSALVRSLENQYPQTDIDKISEHDAILVLGGGLRLPLSPAKTTQLSSGSDRYWHAVNLYKAGKAKQIVLVGGNVFSQPGLQSESFYAAELLQTWGVPKGSIKIEQVSRTTEQNRRYIEAWARESGINRILLVTSAYHMPRALETFSGLAHTLTPAVADILIQDAIRPVALDFLPSAAALNLTTIATHEYLGIVFIRLKRFLVSL